MSYQFHVDDSADIDLLVDLLSAAAGGCIDLIHSDPWAPRSPAVLVESVANGFVNVRPANEDGEPTGDTYPVQLDYVQRVNVW